MGALPAPVVLQIIVEKGAEGFGFTIADSPKGQRVKQILDGTRCQDLVVRIRQVIETQEGTGTGTR